MERNTWRDDEKPETRVYFQACNDCSWEDAESYDSEDDADRRVECPECESDDLFIESDYV